MLMVELLNQCYAHITQLEHIYNVIDGVNKTMYEHLYDVQDDIAKLVRDLHIKNQTK
jgi:hypothetical protein